MNFRAHACRLLLLSAAVTLASCASSTPPARFSQPLSTIITAEDPVRTVVNNPSGDMGTSDSQRLAGKITTQVRTLALSNGGKGRAYELVVNVTRYDRGHAVARALIAGAGQMHIDGIVSVYQVPSRQKVGEFIMSKTFAWGGMYGLVTNMDTIENTFAQAVAQTVTGRK